MTTKAKVFIIGIYILSILLNMGLAITLIQERQAVKPHTPCECNDCIDHFLDAFDAKPIPGNKGTYLISQGDHHGVS